MNEESKKVKRAWERGRGAGQANSPSKTEWMESAAAMKYAASTALSVRLVDASTCFTTAGAMAMSMSAGDDEKLSSCWP